MAENVFSHLAFLSKEYPDLLEEKLRDPCCHTFDGFTVEEFTSGYKKLIHTPKFHDHLKDLLDRHLVAEYHVFRDRLPGWLEKWLREHLDLELLFPSVEGKVLFSGRWRAVPVILTANEAYLRYFMVGAVSGDTDLVIAPPQVLEHLGEDSFQAIETAAAAAANIFPRKAGESLCCYPLWTERSQTGIEGWSLGLPFALGFLAALSGEKFSGYVVATGTIDKEGAIGKVNGLDLKVNSVAGRKEFRAFLYPAENYVPAFYESLDTLPVSNLKEAWLFYSLYSPEKKKRLPFLSDMMENPALFVTNCGKVPAVWVQWTSRNGLLGGVVKEAVEKINLANSLVNSLESCVLGWQLESAKALSGLLNADDLDVMAKTTPVAAFRWCTFNLSLANHRGNIEEADLWTERAFRYYERAKGYGPDIFADFHNHRFVSLQNRYRFEVHLPEAVETTLEELEEHYEMNLKKDYMGHKKLGELYGSIAQNYGFCGTEHIDYTIQYARKACRAFGDGKFPEQREDWLRQFNYMTYAYLDAGEFKLAEEALIQNLEMEDWDEFVRKIPRFSPWQHALTARYLCDTGDKERGIDYLERTFLDRAGRIEKEHPWQLWLYNLGRTATVLGDPEKAETLYRESLQICLSENFGPTVHMMALLPLSGLWKMMELDLNENASLVARLRDVAKNINPGHFRAVIEEEDLSTVLEAVSEKPQILFPFSYR